MCGISARHTPAARGAPRRAGHGHRLSPWCPRIPRGSRPGPGARRRAGAWNCLSPRSGEAPGAGRPPPSRVGVRAAGTRLLRLRLREAGRGGGGAVLRDFTRQPPISGKRTLSERPQCCALSSPRRGHGADGDPLAFVRGEGRRALPAVPSPWKFAQKPQPKRSHFIEPQGSKRPQFRSK